MNEEAAAIGERSFHFTFHFSLLTFNFSLSPRHPRGRVPDDQSRLNAQNFRNLRIFPALKAREQSERGETSHLE